MPTAQPSVGLELCSVHGLPLVNILGLRTTTKMHKAPSSIRTLLRPPKIAPSTIRQPAAHRENNAHVASCKHKKQSHTHTHTTLGLAEESPKESKEPLAPVPRHPSPSPGGADVEGLHLPVLDELLDLTSKQAAAQRPANRWLKNTKNKATRIIPAPTQNRD